MKKIYLLLILSLTLALNVRSQVVINEIYGGGGNAGATYRQDFIELYNNGAAAVDLSAWSVQYASAAGTTWQKTNLTGTIPAHGYYLIQEALGAGGTTNIPTPDATGTIAMSGTGGKVALVNNQTALAGGCPTSAQIVDFAGFGAANCFEGTGPTPAPSNTNSVQRIFSSNTAQDTQNNNVDFATGLPSPVNASGGADVTPPAVSSLSPANGATNVSAAVTATITFNETVAKGASGTISVKRFSDDAVIQTFDITTAAVTVTGSAASFTINTLSFNTQYYIEITSGAFKDLADNDFAGITGNGTWNFTTAAGAPTGTIGTTYNFDVCGGAFPNGFTQYSVTGAQVWACTTFGRDAANLPSGSAPNGVQINGFAGGTNVLNEDWFISPPYDLTATTFPLLSFWSRTAFNGLPLKLKVSTDYVSGDPAAATWTDVNGNFPGQASDVWTLSSNVNLSAFKTTNVHFAFVYTSSVDDGARWTLDDILVVNSAVAPPPELSVSTTDIQFGFVAAASSSVKQLMFTGDDLTGGVTLTATGNFDLSRDNISFTPSVSFTQAEANNVTSTVYVRFSPTVAGQNYTGTVTVSTAGVTDHVVNLKGTSIDPINTLEVVNWNIEWFGSTTFGPTNDAQQQANITTILQNIGADIYGLAEVVSEPRLVSVVSQMPGYAYVLSNYGSHTNTTANPPSALADAQKLAFVYKTSIFSNVSVAPLLSQGINSAADIANPAYNYFASGRFPFMMTADVTLNGVTKTIRFIMIHAKANTSPTATSYARRKAGSDTLHYTLNNLYPNDNIVLLGDFNDDLDQSITAGFTTTSYSAFTTDNINFYSPTLPLSLAGKKSTISYNDVIDHVMLSNEMQCAYMPATANILTDVTSLVANYGTTTTDHYPVFTRYAFTPAPAATISYSGSPFCQSAGTAAVTFTGTTGGTYSSTTGLTIDAATGAIDLTASTPGTYTVTYAIAASGCTPALSTTTSVTLTAAPAATITYSGSPYCQNAGTAAVTATGTTGGTFSSTTGLSINALTGAVNLAGSTTGTYTVTYSIAAAGGCGAFSTTTSITINAAPAATISYSGSPYCQNAGTAAVTATGTTGGTFSSTTGLSINALTGAVNLAGSTTGTYTVTYSIAAAGGCGAFSTTTSITINAAPAATIGYSGSPYCQGAGTASVTQSGTTGGAYSSTTGLVINAATGVVTLAGSTPGNYTVTYTVAATGGCAVYTTTATITVTATPSAAVSYTGAPYCTTGSPATVTQTGTAGGTYSSTTGLSISAATGAIDLSTSTAGTYTVTYSLPASGGCAAVTATTTITVNKPSVAATGATASTTALCGSGTTNLSIQNGTLGSGAAWKWYTTSCGGTLVGTGDILNNIQVNSTTTFYVRAEGICNTTACASVTVTVSPRPSVTVTASPYTNLLPGLTTTLSANTVPPSAANAFTWYRNGVPVTGAAGAALEVNVDKLGSYYVRVTTPDNCTATSNTVIIRDSISDKLFITPNPNTGLFQVRYTSVSGYSALRSITIFDSKGAKVYSKLFSVANPYNSMNVDLRKQGSGLYFIVVADANGKTLTQGKVSVL
jgi:hypothetical protein